VQCSEKSHGRLSHAIPYECKGAKEEEQRRRESPENAFLEMDSVASSFIDISAFLVVLARFPAKRAASNPAFPMRTRRRESENEDTKEFLFFASSFALSRLRVRILNSVAAERSSRLRVRIFLL
jgi:hypothetical protein